MSSDIVLVIAAIWLGSLFTYSGSVKLIEPIAQRASVVQGYRVLPASVSRVVATALPFAEVAVGGLILLAPYARAGFTAAAISGGAFAAAAGSVLVRRINTSCGCAGKASGRVDRATFGRAVLITVAAIAVSAVEVRVPYGPMIFGIAIIPAAIAGLRTWRLSRRHVHHAHHATHSPKGVQVRIGDVKVRPAFAAKQVAVTRIRNADR